MSTDKHLKDLVFLNNLFESLGDNDDMSTDEIKEELRADGIDPDAAVQRLMSTVKQVSANSKKLALDEAREKRLQKKASFSKVVGSFKDWSREQLLDRIKLLSGGGGQMAASYRELEEQSDDNLRALLEDLEMLQEGDGAELDDD